jgi:Xaa-Pro aminopeptidase
MLDSCFVVDRLDRLRAVLAEAEASVMVLTRNVNISYLTGIGGLIDAEDPHAAIAGPDLAVLFTDSRYIETAQTQAAAAGGIWQVKESHSPAGLQEVVDYLSHHARGKIVLEDTMPHGKYQTWERALNAADLNSQEGHLLVEGLRRSKDESELEAIAAAQAITDAAFAQLLDFLRPRQSEQDIAAELDYRMRKLGATGLAFFSIVASGPRGALPHALPSARRVQQGDMLVLDFGAEKDGYCSDMTRTIAFGDPGPEARTIYDTVRAAQEVALARAQAGVAGKEVDDGARIVITKAGYGDYFRHGTSHGLGREVHEKPHCSPLSKDILEVGDVISMEPGIYLPGRFGVRIEDLVAITSAGLRNFTTSPKELIIL